MKFCATTRRSRRAAAVLDFDDLLLRAGFMLQTHEDVRQALSERYRHILVDESRTPTPCRRKSSSASLPRRGSPLAGRGVKPGALFLVGRILSSHLPVPRLERRFL